MPDQPASPSSEDDWNRLCEDFQARWESGQPIGVEDFLKESGWRTNEESADDSSVLIKLIQREMEQRRQKGESPSVDEYVSRFPGVDADSIQDLFVLPAPPPPDYSGPLLPNRYRPLEQIGRGGIGSVWRVHDKVLDRVLAAKVLHKKFALDEGANIRLDREAMLTGSLQHPGVPPIHDRGQLITGSSFFVMKLVEGDTLADSLKQSGDSASSTTAYLKVFEQIAQTVAYAHSQNIIHRDLKPSNVMVGKFNESQIMDWGMAKVIDPESAESLTESEPVNSDAIGKTKSTDKNADKVSTCDPLRDLTRQGDVIGTPAYMAPEQARGEIENLDCRCDVFSLGAILFEILCEQPLYHDVPTAQLLAAAAEGKFQSSRDLLAKADVDADLKEICLECLDPDRERRLSDAGKVAERIRDFLESVENRARQAELSRAQAELKISEERKRKKLAYVLLVVILLACSIGSMMAAWYQRERERQRITNQRDRAKTLVDSLGSAPVEGLDFAIDSLKPLRDPAIVFLKDAFENSERYPNRKRRYAIALSQLGYPQTEYLAHQLDKVPMNELALLTRAMGKDKEAWKQVHARFASADNDDLKSRLALVGVSLGHPEDLNTWLQDPDAIKERCAFIDVCSEWRGELGPLFDFAFSDVDSMVQYLILCGVAEISADRVTDEESEKWSPALVKLCHDASHARVRSTAELILRRWELTIPPAPEDSEQDFRNWYRNSVGMVLIKVDDYPTAQLGSGGYEFFVSDREISSELFRKFVEEDEQSAKRTIKTYKSLNHKNMVGDTYKEVVERNLARIQLGDDDSTTPLRNVGYYCALRFCNWLSRREGLEPYYVDQSDGEVKDTISADPRFEIWTTNPQADGYRLPDYFEFRKIRNPIDDVGLEKVPARYHKRFAWYFKNSSDPQPIATRLPNELGVFDAYGNVSELSHFRNEVQHPHSIMGRSYRALDIRDLNKPAKGSEAVHYAPETGFRVIRLSKPDAAIKHVRSVNAKVGEMAKLIPVMSPREWIVTEKKLRDIGNQLLDLGDRKNAKRTHEMVLGLGNRLEKKNRREGLFVKSQAQLFLARLLIEDAVEHRQAGNLRFAKNTMYAAQSKLNDASANYRQASAYKVVPPEEDEKHSRALGEVGTELQELRDSVRDK